MDEHDGETKQDKKNKWKFEGIIVVMLLFWVLKLSMVANARYNYGSQRTIHVFAKIAQLTHLIVSEVSTP